jgi:disulfide bond formation protein DsbB
MTTSTFSLFFALLSLAALTGTIVSVVVLAVARRRPGWEGMRNDVRRVALPLAWIVAIVTTLGSLYMSEVAHFTPCALCWYQRIAMYPLVLMLGIATFRRDASIRVYVIAQCAVGGTISVYHSYIQAFPPENGTSFCTAEAPCTARYVWELGFISLPFMALTAFAFIGTLMVASGPSRAADAGLDLLPRTSGARA